ncbi:MAG: hypothetical protein ACI8P0_004700 [Planctomycetaceae bacterium]|jgi:hypothetical protein
MTPTDTVTTTSLLYSDFLLAARSGLLDSPSARIVAWIVGLLVVIGAAWGAAIVSGAMRRKAARTAKKPKNVFDEICMAQGLSPKEKRQASRAAAILKLSSPSLLFVDSGLLTQLATSDRDDAADFRKLSDRLFPPDSIPSESDLAELTETPATV